MKHNTISKLLLGAAGALLAVFLVKNIVDYTAYSHTVNSAPFTLHIALNAFYFIIPSAIAAGIGLYIGGRVRLLSIITALLTGAALLTVIIAMLSNNAFFDSILYGTPLLISDLILGIFTVISRCRKNKAKKNL